MSHAPRILAIETSGRQGSLVAAAGATVLAVRTLSPAMRHAAELMPAVRELTQGQGWEPKQIEHIYLSIGPGSFTGLRIAVAVARALHQAIGCKLVAVPSLEVMAQNALVLSDVDLVMPIIDAKRNQVFAAGYARNASGGLDEIAAAQLIEPGRFVTEMIAKAGPRGWRQLAMLGEGLQHYQPPGDTGVRALPAEMWAPSAVHVHRLGFGMAERGLFADAMTLLPMYIRLPEAEEVYQKKQAAGAKPA